MGAKKQRLEIKFKLMEKGIKQKVLALELGYTPAFVNMVLQGKKPITKKFHDWIKKNLGGVNSEDL